jgi:hypothetical protein
MYAAKGAAIARMFMARMPSSAKPRRTSSDSRRSLDETGDGRAMRGESTPGRASSESLREALSTGLNEFDDAIVR